MQTTAAKERDERDGSRDAVFGASENFIVVIPRRR